MSYAIRDYVNDATVWQALGLTAEHRSLVSVETDWAAGNFRDTWCDPHHPLPAAVHATYWRNEGDEHEADWVEVEASWSLGAARNGLHAIVNDPRLDTNNGVEVYVNAWAYVYNLQTADQAAAA